MKNEFFNTTLFKNVRNFVLAIVVLSAILTFLFIDIHSSLSTYLIGFGWSLAICSTQWIGHVYINYRISKKIDWISHPWKRALVGAFFILVYAVVAFVSVQSILFWLVNGRFPHPFVHWMIRSSLYAVSIAFGVSFFFTTVGFFRAWKKSLFEAEHLKTEMLAYKYEALQNQINPHFLFNSFNVLSDLVYADQKMAVKFINQLSELFRYVLDNRDKELVSLQEELNFIDSFIYLLKTRFDNKLNIQIDIKPQPDELIVPMALQMLVENAVKHNEVSDAHPLQVTIRKQNGFIEVTNNLQPKPVGEDSKKTGLKNIVQQYTFFTNQEIQIIPSSSEFIVRIPIIKGQV